MEEASKEFAILTAAIHEFAEKGFDQASTNQIAKASGVSKGLIFHYYESKEKLFEACVNYALTFSEEKLDYKNWNFSDHLIQKIRSFVAEEIKFCRDYPDVFHLLMNAFVHPPEQLSDQMVQLFKDVEKMARQFFEQIIGSLDLKDDVAPEVLMAVIQSHYEYYMNRAMAFLKAYPDARMEDVRPFMDQFINMLAMSLRGLLKNEES
ncbi:TetR/AcrR family transcriptional regulator [Sporolactobacillus sp. CPB3-1]|uniref:TetR/AcrR family transcriptional regulator n=1 Tax=Sporolactobacillus mangiferae TaxID=2940498 RepID=A0ABT0MEI0_9BACL|nr:TetR/AcrR family transcriptional regulator [Sporolactobacillus mangiferae]MCL1632725.1 TetR/AcrR family transcriptional regulator [Sporolactobacillus mangiferae]